MIVKKIFILTFILASFNTITPSAARKEKESLREKFEREFCELYNSYDPALDHSTDDALGTPPAPQALTMPPSPAHGMIPVVIEKAQSPIQWDDEDQFTCTWPHDGESIEADLDARKKADQAKKLREKNNQFTEKKQSQEKAETEHTLHLCASTINLGLPRVELEQNEFLEPRDFADLFEQITPGSITLAISFAPQKEHFEAFNAGTALLHELTFNTALERRNPKANSRDIQKKLNEKLSPLLTFLSKTAVHLKAVSAIDFGDSTNPVETHSHEKQKSLENHFTLTLICDAIVKLSENNTKMAIGMAELPAVLREPATICQTPSSKSPQSPNLEETRQQFKRDNVIQFLHTLKVTRDNCLSVFIRKPKALESAGATARVKK